MKRFLLVLTVGLLLLLPAAASADAPKNRGLLITPLRQYLNVNAGGQIGGHFTIANLTDDTMVVNLSAKQFSVTDYTYNYTFSPPNDWLTFKLPQVSLQPNDSKEVDYTITVPEHTAAGGQYYTLLASATVATGSLTSTVQAASLLYLTVNGKLTSISHLQSSSIQWLSFGRTIPFKLNPVNTGNVYSFVYVSGELHGPLVKPPETSTAHLLLPGHVRSLGSTIPSPVLPGIYKAVYGYKTESNWIVQQSHWVVFIPPWFIAFLLVLALIGSHFIPRWRKRPKAKAKPEPENKNLTE